MYLDTAMRNSPAANAILKVAYPTPTVQSATFLKFDNHPLSAQTRCSTLTPSEVFVSAKIYISSPS